MLRLISIAVLLFALAASPASARRGALTHSSAKLLACDQSDHAATFRGTLRAWGKATTLQMRFTLRSRTSGQALWADPEPPEGFDTWTTADPGIKRYIVDKTVTGLVPGAAYRTIIHFRWRNAKGTVVTRAVKRTPVCRQPDTRANLQVAKVMAVDGTNGQAQYTVRVLNDGDTEAPLFSTGLLVGGTQLTPVATTEPLVEGDDVELTFTGPHCAAGSSVVATADTGGSVDESDEMDNALTVVCPL